MQNLTWGFNHKSLKELFDFYIDNIGVIVTNVWYSDILVL